MMCCLQNQQTIEKIFREETTEETELGMAIKVEEVHVLENPP